MIDNSLGIAQGVNANLGKAHTRGWVSNLPARTFIKNARAYTFSVYFKTRCSCLVRSPISGRKFSYSQWIAIIPIIGHSLFSSRSAETPGTEIKLPQTSIPMLCLPFLTITGSSWVQNNKWFQEPGAGFLVWFVVSGRKESSKTPGKIDGRKYRSQLPNGDGIHWAGELHGPFAWKISWSKRWMIFSLRNSESQNSKILERKGEIGKGKGWGHRGQGEV